MRPALGGMSAAAASTVARGLSIPNSALLVASQTSTGEPASKSSISPVPRSALLHESLRLDWYAKDLQVHMGNALHFMPTLDYHSTLGL